MMDYFIYLVPATSVVYIITVLWRGWNYTEGRAMPRAVTTPTVFTSVCTPKVWALKSLEGCLVNAPYTPPAPPATKLAWRQIQKSCVWSTLAFSLEDCACLSSGGLHTRYRRFSPVRRGMCVGPLIKVALLEKDSRKQGEKRQRRRWLWGQEEGRAFHAGKMFVPACIPVGGGSTQQSEQ